MCLKMINNDTEVMINIEKLLNISIMRSNKLVQHKPSYRVNGDGYIIGLNLSNCEISNLDSIVGELIGLAFLSELNLQSNHLIEINAISRLKKLTTLILSNNKIVDISPLKELKYLSLIRLDKNAVSNIDALANLEYLETVYLVENLIQELPPWIVEIPIDILWEKENIPGCFNFYGNPVINPALEIIMQGKDALKRYFEKVKEEGVDFIFEAKLTLVGDGGSGKTSLQNRLLNKEKPLPNTDSRTRGIAINDWKFEYKNREHIVHIWDFGGQDVYYPVHKFFLTENSVFVLLASSRQQHHNFNYWIPTIYQFGSKSPIILGQTCFDGNNCSWNDLGYYFGNPNFNIIRNKLLFYYELNLPNNNEGLENLRQAIIEQIVKLPHYGKGVPKSWIPVRNKIAQMAKNNACITFEKFKEICKQTNSKSFSRLVDIEDCARFFHSIGLILWYYSINELNDWVILQPEWAMSAVYKIIDDDKIQKSRGKILEADFLRLWCDKSYDNKHNILKKMLFFFKIAFPEKLKKEDYIIPARMLSMPSDMRWASDEPYLSLVYKYDFMPKGIVNQVTAELSRYIVSEELIWNNAVNLTNADKTAECQIEEDFYFREIRVRAKGKDPRSLVSLVKNAIDDITDSYKDVRPQIYVPCICDYCTINPNPTKFLYSKLIEKLNNNQETIRCIESDKLVYINELLYNVDMQRFSMQIQTIKLFLASSYELAQDRSEFEKFINRENKYLINRGIFIRLELWEDFIDCISKTRLQDEYNKTIEQCDIFVSLFFTKVGKYTREEFDKAFGQFKKTGRPLIYTFFKDEPINISKILQNSINSKFSFERKLKSLGHFSTSYKNIAELQVGFNKQLEKVIPLILETKKGSI